MTRKAKNILMVAAMVLCVAGIGFTLWYSSQNASGMASEMGQPGEMGAMNQMGGMGQGETPPEKQDGDSSSDMQTPPEKPDGDSTGAPSEMGDMGQMGQIGQMGGMEQPSTETSDIINVVTWLLLITFSAILSFFSMHLIISKGNKHTFKEVYQVSDKKIILILGSVLMAAVLSGIEIYATNNWLGGGGQEMEQGIPGGMNSSNVSYSAVVTIDESKTLTNQSYTSSSADENVILATGKIEATVSDTQINKTGDSDGGDSTSFYGNNSGIIAKDSATFNLKNLTITTDATGANGVFSYGGSATTNNSASDGTTVNISDSTITTNKDNSGGIMTTGGGIMNAYNLNITTAGTSSAAIRSDRGGGNVNVAGGTYTTTGVGSPSIYSTAEIKVANAKLIAQASEGVVIEGANSVELDNTELTDSNTKLNGQSTTYKNIFLYQSMSGDASTDGGSTFSAKNSKIITNNGDTLYVTNTTATINLENNTITNNDSTGNFLRIQKDSWGNEGSNGGVVTLNLTNQIVTGDIVVDSISTLTANLQSGSSYTGTLNGENSAKSLTLKLSKDSKIKLTGDSYVTSLENADSSNSNIDFNGHKLYVNGKAVN